MLMKSTPILLLPLFLILIGCQAYQMAPLVGSKHSRISTLSTSMLHASKESEDGQVDGVMDRRAVISSTSQATAASLVTLLLGGGQWSDSAVAADGGQTIVITGSNSGIGFEAAKQLAGKGNTVVLACRTMTKAQDAMTRIQADTSSGKLIPAECNLASMASIDSFVKNLNVGTIDVACFNAGLALNTADTVSQRTADGFELTVGTNHFGHFYLNHLLLPKIDTSNGRIVVTASSVHDPASPGGKQGTPATLGQLEGLARDGRKFDMVDGGSYNADKAYKDSKLCNVLFTRELQRRLAANAKTKDIVVNCFSPGLITSGNFFRYQNPLFSKAFDLAASKLIGVAETNEWGGGCLSYMTTLASSRGEFYDSPPGSSKYGAEAYGREFTVGVPSVEARETKEGEQLWSLSEQLLGIKS